MVETHSIWLKTEEKTRFCGESMAATIYGDVDVYLVGELGAGKTTFLDGFSTGLGISDPLPSPTYALEQRHTTASGAEFIHLDLYRLPEKQTTEVLQQSDDHTGIRCIEWANRMTIIPENGVHIHLDDPAEKEGRVLNISYKDLPYPSAEDIQQWREEVALPDHIIRHCNAVAQLCDELSDLLMEQGFLVRKQALRRAAEVHDLFRFIDFSQGAAHDPSHDEPDDPVVWTEWKEKFADVRHEAACAKFLCEKEFSGFASIVETHGLQLPPRERQTIEQKVLYYADKRMKLDEKVTLKERFEDFNKRYGGGEWSDDGKIWYKQAQEVEQDLFGGPPLL